MRKLIFLILLLLPFVQASAQMEQSKVKSSNDPWKYGVHIAASYDYPSSARETEGKFGAKFDFVFEKHLAYNIYFKPSVGLLRKGFSADYPYNLTADVVGYFLSLDGAIELKFGDERKGNGLFLALTPFVTYGLFGQTTGEVTNPNSDNFQEVFTQETFDVDGTTRRDMGFKLGLGYDVNHHWSLNADYIFGFVNITNNSACRWRGVNVGLTYFF